MRSLAVLLALSGLLAALPAPAHPPYALEPDGEGNVYFSDLQTVWRLSAEGSLSVFRAHVPGTHVHAIAMGPDGAISGDQNHYNPATQRFYSGLWVRTLDGVEDAVVPLTELPPPGMGVWKDTAGNRYSSQWISPKDRRIVLLRRQVNGGVDVLFDETGGVALRSQATVESVGGMSFGNDGSLFFANGGVLRQLAPQGTVTTIYDGGARSSLRGLAVAPDGQILAADSGARTVIAIGPGGSVSKLYQETTAWSPTAVALAGGRLLVLEANDDPYERENRVRVVEVVDGRGTVVASPAFPNSAHPTAPTTKHESGHGVAILPFASLLALALALGVAAWRSRFMRIRKIPAP